MAELVLGSYLFRYPLGGMASWVLQYLEGFARLGHRVTFVEAADHHGACFDVATGTMGDDPTPGIASIRPHLERIGLGDRWCMVDVHGTHHGLSDRALRAAFARADAFFDMGTHGAFEAHAAVSGTRVLLDGEPGFTQVRLERARRAGAPAPAYDHHVTNGANIGRAGCDVPTAGRRWLHAWHPVVTERVVVHPPPTGAPFTTLMNWRSHREVELDGARYGQKDRSFVAFADLPSRTSVPLELAVAGLDEGSAAELATAGWRLRAGHDVSRTVEDFEAHVRASAGEIAICKHAFVAHRTGWFSDRSAAYLAAGRPVVFQDTGLADHLPTGEGLLLARDAGEAAESLERIAAEPERHARAARRIAEAELDVSVVLPRLLRALGVA
ncbi:MAG TPA: hypothetical protein VFU14_19460 [Acidimicrobiales bacterium]|nr:hypothetical protein [Acidimicrobiales bacterium]